MPIARSYIVTYDSGFAPNPFAGFCTLATCKPEIRRLAEIGDWIIGTGSNRKGVERGGYLVYAMRVEECLTFSEYWNDPRFTKKKPIRNASYHLSCGDNIYCPRDDGNGWRQISSYHRNKDGTPSAKHIKRDTSVDRVLISRDFVYYGAQGPKIPENLADCGFVLPGRGYKNIREPERIGAFVAWLRKLEKTGYAGKPFDMVNENKRKAVRKFMKSPDE